MRLLWLLLGSGCDMARCLGDACLPLDVRSLLRGEAVEAVSTECKNLIAQAGTKVCSPECHEALTVLQAERCYRHLSQPQRLQPRFESPLNARGQAAHTLNALQGIWYGLYPASGIELVEARYNPSTDVLEGTKLTGNDFVGAGRVSWTLSTTSCKVVSSMWKGVYTPSWDTCQLRVQDRDHLQLSLPLGDGGYEVLSFVRATLPLLLGWDQPLSPTRGFGKAMFHCGVSAEDVMTSTVEALIEAFHHSHGTVLTDQLLTAFPFLLLGGWQMMQAHHPAAQSLLWLLGGTYCVALYLRLSYLRVAQ